MPANIFISYSHIDAPALERLHKHLAVLRQEGLIKDWYDRDILAGDRFDEAIEAELNSADIFLALASPDFLASSYCVEKEMARAIERDSAGELRIIPVILEPCEWLKTPLGKFKATPKDGKPVAEWPNANSAYLDVTTEIRRIVESKNKAGDASATRNPPGALEPKITMTSFFAVDEKGLDEMIGAFGADWPEVRIAWPRSSDSLISNVQSAIERFDDEGTNIQGSEYFITRAPAAVADAVRDRANIQKRLPGLVRRSKGFDRKGLQAAIKSYLLVANFRIYEKLRLLSCWGGLAKLNLKTPSATVPFQDISLEAAYARLFAETVDIHHGRLLHIGNYKIDWSKDGYVYLYAPKYVISRFDVSVSPRNEFSQQSICRWLIPQFELAALDIDGALLPETYEGDWQFGVVKNERREEIY